MGRPLGTMPTRASSERGTGERTEDRGHDAHARELGKIRGNRVVIVTRKDSPAKNRFHRQPVMNL